VSGATRQERWLDATRFSLLVGYDASAYLVAAQDGYQERGGEPVQAPPRDEVQTQPRQRRENVKEAIVKARQFENLKLQGEEVAEFNYRPTACREAYRMVVLRNNLTREKGEQRLFDETRDFRSTTEEMVEDSPPPVLS